MSKNIIKQAYKRGYENAVVKLAQVTGSGVPAASTTPVKPVKPLLPPTGQPNPAQTAGTQTPAAPQTTPGWATAQGMKNWRARFNAADAAGRQAMLQRLDARGRGLTGAQSKNFNSIANQLRAYAQRTSNYQTRGPTVRKEGPAGHVEMYYDPNAKVSPQYKTSPSYYNGNRYRMAGGITVTRPPIPRSVRWS